MLEEAGYQCRLPDDDLRAMLRSHGCDTVLSSDDLVRGMGYDRPMRLPTAGPRLLNTCDLYVDVKAHRNGPRLWRHFPRLQNRTLWYRINGGKPEHVVRRDGQGKVVEDCGDEVNPPCPVLTPNRWYALRDGLPEQGDPYPHWDGRAYSMWPPFRRFQDYASRQRITLTDHKPQPPVCLIHNLQGWGYGALVDNVRRLGVRCYGAGSPDGLVKNADVPAMLSDTLAYVHLKSNDAPGYSLYEALASACPVVVSRRLIWRCRMHDLFVPGETCLVFDRETHDGLSPEDVSSCTGEISSALDTLSDKGENVRIGRAGQDRLRKLMWSSSRPGDVSSLREFMSRHFGG